MRLKNLAKKRSKQHCFVLAQMYVAFVVFFFMAPLAIRKWLRLRLRCFQKAGSKGRRKKRTMKVTYICRSPQKKAATYFIFIPFIDFFIAFLGVS
jgi:hypothetical protein